MTIRNEQKDAYMVLGYACNHRCSCCPCGKDQVADAVFPRERIAREIADVAARQVTDVTLSGGEPTIHPDFLWAVGELLDRGIALHLLTNGDRFSDPAFADAFIALARGRNVSVTTTFHSHQAQQHEASNGVKGSFGRSLAGLTYLDQHGINVAVKHCLTGHNHRDLPAFLRFVTAHFSRNAEIQLWGIDLCGVDEKTAEEMFVPFAQLGAVLEEALAEFEAHGDGRLLTVNNLPLCCCDCYFWKYFSPPLERTYIDHQAEGEAELRPNSGPLSPVCRECPVAGQCRGAYATVFDRFGPDVVRLPVELAGLTAPIAVCAGYDADTLDRLFFSPYLRFYMTLQGLTFVNRLTGGSVNLRLRQRDIAQVMGLFTGGATQQQALAALSAMPGVQDAAFTLNTLLRRGIIE